MRRLSWLIPFAVLLFIAAPASARPRDDATAGAYRCAPIGDMRQWLDCFYGAAQPVRTQLGLPSAPAAQVRLSLSPPAGNASSEDLRLRDDVLAAVLRCYASSEDRQWLDCYYESAQPARARLGLSPGPQVPQRISPGAVAAAPAQRVMPASIPEQQFGMDVARPALAHDLDHVTARMNSYSFTPYHIFTVSLANGQTWRQLSGDINNAHWRKPAASYVVTISHGAFRSFNLEVKGIPGIFKVERIQ
jgi:hypothetical protein